MVYKQQINRQLANLNVAIVMQTFENLILQNCSTEFYAIAHTWSSGMCN